MLHKLKLGWHLVLKGVGLKSSTFRLFLMNEKGCTKFEHTLRVCIAVLSFWGLIWDASSDAEYIFVDVERQRNSAPRMMLVYFSIAQHKPAVASWEHGQKSR